MEKNQVHPIPFVTNAQAFLAANETEIAAELKEKGLKMPYKCFLQVGFGIFILESEKLQEIRVFDLFIGTDRIFGRRYFPFLSMAALFRDRAVRS
jgi:hypothetical protein